MGRRFVIAMGAYLGLAAVAGWILDGALLWITWIVLAAFALKTWLAVLKERQDSDIP